MKITHLFISSLVLLSAQLSVAKDASYLKSSHCFSGDWMLSVEAYYPDMHKNPNGETQVKIYNGAILVGDYVAHTIPANNFPTFGRDMLRFDFKENQDNVKLQIQTEVDDDKEKYAGYAAFFGPTNTNKKDSYTEMGLSCQNSYYEEHPTENFKSYLPQKELPPQVCSIRYYSESDEAYMHVCTGTIISKQTVLTAAHCIVPTPRPVQVVCPDGSTFSSNTYKNEIHDLYDDSSEAAKETSASHDIALVFLDKPAQLAPIAIAKSASEVEDAILKSANQCIMVGYGDAAENLTGKQHGVTYQYPPQKFTTKETFEEKLKAGKVLSDPQRFVREGDSGGPILCRDGAGAWRVVGVHSYMLPIAVEAASASVGVNAQWIAEKIKSDEPK
ncbi:MAG: trypsin-like serine protease [Bdellovibrionaceae bacterium]|nr:trypsin-like serine protease [Pseudobdellovibrionaceae bacterium]